LERDFDTFKYQSQKESQSLRQQLINAEQDYQRELQQQLQSIKQKENLITQFEQENRYFREELEEHKQLNQRQGQEIGRLLSLEKEIRFDLNTSCLKVKQLDELDRTRVEDIERRRARESQMEIQVKELRGDIVNLTERSRVVAALQSENERLTQILKLKSQDIEELKCKRVMKTTC